jgi:hypothetical protein
LPLGHGNQRDPNLVREPKVYDEPLGHGGTMNPMSLDNPDWLQTTLIYDALSDDRRSGSGVHIALKEFQGGCAPWGVVCGSTTFVF